MRKPLVVKEFDIITSNAEYDGIDGYGYLDKKRFDELSHFIRDYTEQNDNADVLEFLRLRYNRKLGEYISINNYVGVIQLKSGFQIQILPKIDLGESQDDRKTKTVFLSMLRSMRDFPGKAFNHASLNVDKMNLYELFINMYLQEVRRLVKVGIKSGYVSQEDNIGFIRGKLQISQHLKVNIGHNERFYVLFDDFISDRAENRLIKSTLIKLQHITDSAENSREIRQLLTSFEMVKLSDNYDKDFSKVVADRNMKEYDMLMKWSKVFLYDKGFSTFSGKTASRALLFPMESVFEKYVAQQIKKVFRPCGWNVKCQERTRYLFTKPDKRFGLKPDIIIRKGDRTIIMDTKWKRLCNNYRNNYGISQADMYQMYAYSKKYGATEVWLLYPVNNDVRDIGYICYKDDDIDVNVFFIDLNPDHIEESFNKLKGMLATIENRRTVSER